MKIALVHDYLSEFGGAERVLLTLSEMYPEAPIYTAFARKNSEAYRRFKDKKIIESKWARVPFFRTKLYSPLRFLAPLIWRGFEKDLSKYDVVISSASWYATKGFGSRAQPKADAFRRVKRPFEICYCHTPPRWLYGYRTSVEWQKYFLVRVYGNLIGYFMRKYDYLAAQRVNVMVANSKEVQGRIDKFYRRKSIVIYPPVELLKTKKVSNKRNYYLVISRIVGGKGLELAIKTANKYGFNLKIAGEGAGWGRVESGLKKLASDKVEWLGRVSDEKLVKLYSEAKAFLALAENEDFGITPVEAMSCGTPVVAYKGGGYKESVVGPSSQKLCIHGGQPSQKLKHLGGLVSGKLKPTGVFFEKQSVDSLGEAIKKLEKLKIKPEDCIKQAEKFSRERFVSKVDELVKNSLR